MKPLTWRDELSPFPKIPIPKYWENPKILGVPGNWNCLIKNIKKSWNRLQQSVSAHQMRRKKFYGMPVGYIGLSTQINEYRNHK